MTKVKRIYQLKNSVIFENMRIGLISTLLISFLVVHAQNLKWTSYDFYLGDTVNRIDRNNVKQGRWVYLGKDRKGKKYRLYKNSQVVEDGFFDNDKKTKIWKTFYNSGKLKSEITYVDDEPNGAAKFFNTDGKLIAQGIMKGVDFVDNYFLYDDAGNKFKKSSAKKNTQAYLDFSGMVQKLGKEQSQVKINVERNDVDIYDIMNNSNGTFNLKLELNFDYIIRFSKEGFNDFTLEINTDVKNLFDTTVYKLENWKINMSDNIANTIGNELFSLMPNKPAGKIYFNKRKRRFTTDGAYVNLFTRQFKGISESTKFLLAQTADENKKLEIENLRMESERKLSEINMLKQAQDLKDIEIKKKEAEILAERFEGEKKEKEIEIAAQNKRISDLQLEQQKIELDKKHLEAEKNAKEIERLAILKKMQDMELKSKQKALTDTYQKLSISNEENEKQAKELSLANREKEIQDKELKQQMFYIYAMIAGVVIGAFFIFFIYRSLHEKKKANALLEKQAIEISKQKREIEDKSKLIELKNLETEQSIQYARRIQDAILPTHEEISKHLKDYFILYKSKDIVSGDFYFFSSEHAKNNRVIFASVDCTGHGVPGAFMSMIGNEKLKDALDITSEPGKILQHLNKGVKIALHQSDHVNATRDGMDLCLCSISTKAENGNYSVSYSGANRPLWFIKGGEGKLTEVKATKVAIGGLTIDTQEFVQHDLNFQKGDSLYMFSDGFADQFGGPNKKKLMTGKFKEILESLQHLSLSEQKKFLNTFIDDWMKDSEQIDDILVIGVKLT